MPRKRTKRSQRKANIQPTSKELKRDGLEKKNFRFNNYSQVTLRDSWFGTYANQQCYAAFYVDVNGYGWNLYDGQGGAISGNAFNSNYSSVWADTPPGPVGGTGQFAEWANLYSTYTVQSAGLRLTPFSFTSTGSQGPITMLTGGQGIVAALIAGGGNLNPQIFSGALGDTKNLRMVMPFKQAQASLDFSFLIPAECPTTFRQTVFEGFSTGFRQLFPSRVAYGRPAGDPDVLGAQLPAIVAFMPFTFNDDQLTNGKALAVFQPYANVTFMQRRTSLASLSSRAFRAFRTTQFELEMQRIDQFNLLAETLEPRSLPAPQESKPAEPRDNSQNPQIVCSQSIMQMLSREIGTKDQADLSKYGIHPHPGPDAEPL